MPPLLQVYVSPLCSVFPFLVRILAVQLMSRLSGRMTGRVPTRKAGTSSGFVFLSRHMFNYPIQCTTFRPRLIRGVCRIVRPFQSTLISCLKLTPLNLNLSHDGF